MGIRNGRRTKWTLSGKGEYRDGSARDEAIRGDTEADRQHRVETGRGNTRVRGEYGRWSKRHIQDSKQAVAPSNRQGRNQNKVVENKAKKLRKRQAGQGNARVRGGVRPVK